MSSLRRFVVWNREINLRYTPWAWRAKKYHEDVDLIIAEEIQKRGSQTVLDVGAGRTSSYAGLLEAKDGRKVIGVDVEPTEMAENAFLDERIVADASVSLGVPDGSVDAIVCKATIEHLPDTEAFLRHASAALRPGGILITSFPGKLAPFVIINRLMPERVSGTLLKHLVPGQEGIIGFKTYYDRTTYSAFTRNLRKSGFEVERERIVFWSSSYFAFFTPVYAASLLLDLLRAASRSKNIASYYIFVCRKDREAASEHAA